MARRQSSVRRLYCPPDSPKPQSLSSLTSESVKSVLGQCTVANKFLTHPTLLAWLCNLGADGVLPGGDIATMTVCVWECMCVRTSGTAYLRPRFTVGGLLEHTPI